MKINFESVKVKLLPGEGVHPRRPQPESGSPPPRKPGRRTFTLIHIIDIIKCCDCSVILRRRGTSPSCCPGPRCAAGSDPCQDHPGHSGDRITSFCNPPQKNQLINKGNVFVRRSLRCCRIWSALEVQFSNWFWSVKKLV